MAKRIISSLIGIALLVVILCMYDTIVLNIAIALISVIAVYELLTATKYFDKKTLSASCLLISAIIPFLTLSPIYDIYRPIIFVFAILVFSLLLRYHNRIKIEQIMFSFTFSVLVPYSLSTIIFIRDMSAAHGRFFILLSLGGAWLGDSGAYFVGTFLGKHKLCPTISPKKTVEGLIGGILTTSLAFMFMGWVCYMWCKSQGNIIYVNYVALFIVGIICDLLGVLGDLSASIVKRQCQIKDFGNIMPGHGGVLDRFDSVLFVLPFMYVLLKFLEQTDLFVLIK